MPEPPPRRPEGSAPSPGVPPSPAPAPRAKKRTPKVERRTVWTYVFFIGVAILAVVGGLQLYNSFFGDKDPAVGDHIHAALGVNVCGNQVRNAPEFETQAGTSDKAGLHSHGDGLIHMHPFTEDEAGGNATVGLFFEYGGWELSEDHMALPGWAEGIDVTNGAPCPDGRPGKLRWAVDGEEQDGNPADFAPEDGDEISIAFIPEGDAIPPPPAEVLQVLPNPADTQKKG